MILFWLAERVSSQSCVCVCVCEYVRVRLRVFVGAFAVFVFVFFFFGCCCDSHLFSMAKMRSFSIDQWTHNGFQFWRQPTATTSCSNDTTVTSTIQPNFRWAFRFERETLNDSDVCLCVILFGACPAHRNSDYVHDEHLSRLKCISTVGQQPWRIKTEHFLLKCCNCRVCVRTSAPCE